MTAARELIQRLRNVEKDPEAMLRTLQGLERDLISLGGSYDDNLAQALEMVKRVFSGAQLVEIRPLLNCNKCVQSKLKNGGCRP